MAFFSTVPLELFHEVYDHLDPRDIVRLSMTCRAQRAQLVPRIFRSIRFHNSHASASSALEAVHTFGQFVKWITFDCFATPGYENSKPALKPAARRVLEGHATPNITTIFMLFKFDLEDWAGWDDNGARGINVFEKSETKNEVAAQEQSWHWRALMNETWQALAANARVRQLYISGLVPKATSAFFTDEFRQFLSRLTWVTIDIWGAEYHWNTNMQPNTKSGYVEFLSALDDTLFRYMTALRYLDIRASHSAPLGLAGTRHIPLALKPEHLPELDTLRLENCFVGPELVEFIQGHAEGLRHLDVEYCTSAGVHGLGGAENAMSWAEFFDRVRKAKPSLTKLLAGSNVVPYSRGMGGAAGAVDPYYAWYAGDAGLDEVLDEIIAQVLGGGRNTHSFSYSYLDVQDGFFTRSEAISTLHHKGTADQKAYDRLMEYVQKNAIERSGWQ
ncbi:hypothetical protein C2857_001014 [Epichloe festucae Fl1]|uniref:F-box domain-containing protein n=1 Tax=Epichloe festucae (strain Fl1) TaxID=877507 RepID=A0A7U3Q1C7_EPIFF|nr:hypothetical protein C2857_001014 [Epichloe festucae Fl1]